MGRDIDGDEWLGSSAVRRSPVGAELRQGGGASFRVWAPARSRVEVVLEGGETVELARELGPDGYFSGVAADARAGSRYRFRIDGGETLYPDPASRFQPEGPHGPSQIVDPSAYRWSDDAWRGVGTRGQVLYELHVGTFTREGTWRAAMRELDALAELGVTVIEMMPVADFAGDFGWGYDGVNLFAPTRLYGEPDDLRAFIDRAHGLGVGVILDVVYNHFGPEGNYLSNFSRGYFTADHETDWGEAIDFDGEGAGPVREYFLANASYWIDEFHFDGLRLDATQNIYDEGAHAHILTEIGERVRAAARGRSTLVVVENESQDTTLVRPRDEGGYGLDAAWNDDFHHAAWVALTGKREAYMQDYMGSPQELVAAAKWGYLYQGQYYAWQKKGRGTPTLGCDSSVFVSYLQNHDQIGNSLRGERMATIASPARIRALTALLLLGPGTPLLFQGQEFGATTPFLFFADHEPDLVPRVRAGRAEFLAQFPSIAAAEASFAPADPASRAVFERCKLDFAERSRNDALYTFHRELLALRRTDPPLVRERRGFDGAVLGDDAFVLRWFGPAGDDRILLVNLGKSVRLPSVAEPLVAPPRGKRWKTKLTTEEPRFGGAGAAEAATTAGFFLAAECASFLVPDVDEEGHR